MLTNPARGMRDFLPADVRRREFVIGVIKEVYERYGFEPLETPAVENIETLLGKYGEEGNQLIFKILKRGEHEKSGEADLALRYDLTVPLARVVAQYRSQLPKFFKRYQIQPVWRADRPARGRYREFYQCDVDALGSRSMVVEAELCAAVSEVLVKLGFRDFSIRLNHRKLLDGMMYLAMIEKPLHGKVLVAIDKLEKIGEHGVRLELLKLGLVESSVDTIIHLSTNLSFWAPTHQIQPMTFSTDAYTSNCQKLDGIYEYVKGFDYQSESVKTFSSGWKELRDIVELTKDLDCSRRMRIDPSLARGLSYYTGAIMEISAPGLSSSLGGGGRYDNLVGSFSGEEIPACGFSLGLERIITLMAENTMFPPDLSDSPADVMVTVWPDSELNSAKNSLALAQYLRNEGLRVDLYPVRNVKLDTQTKYAKKRGYPFVVIMGDTEEANDVVKIRDMQTWEETLLRRGEVRPFIEKRLQRNG